MKKGFQGESIPDSAQPCWMPLCTLKGAHRLPLTFSTLSMLLDNIWILAIKPVMKPKNLYDHPEEAVYNTVKRLFLV